MKNVFKENSFEFLLMLKHFTLAGLEQQYEQAYSETEKDGKDPKDTDLWALDFMMCQMKAHFDDVFFKLQDMSTEEQQEFCYDELKKIGAI